MPDILNELKKPEPASTMTALTRCKGRLLRFRPHNSSSHGACVCYMVRVDVVLYSSLRRPAIAVAIWASCHNPKTVVASWKRE